MEREMNDPAAHSGRRPRGLRRTGLAVAVLAAASLVPMVPGDTAGAAGPGYLTLQFGRSQWHTASSQTCAPLAGSVSLEQVAAQLKQRGRAGTGSAVVNYTRESTRGCRTAFPVQYSSWADMARLRDTYGWSFISNGQTHRDMTQMTLEQQQTESCGSKTAFVNHGHLRTEGLFAYGNDKSTLEIQANVVSKCFAYGRKYGPGRNLRSALTAPWMQSTYTMAGGKCNNRALPCYTMATKTGTRYDSPDKLAALMAPAADEWTVVQGYRFVTGKQEAPEYFTWDCTSPDWRNHWTTAIEMYCLSDYLSAVDRIPAGVVVADPYTVGKAWGRIP